MKLLLRILGVLGLAAVAYVAWFAWGIFGPSTIVIENTGRQAATLVLTDAEPTVSVWSGELKPGAKKRVMVWFKYEGGPELQCRDKTSAGVAHLGYVTSHMPVNADIAVIGCDNIDVKVRY